MASSEPVREAEDTRRRGFCTWGGISLLLTALLFGLLIVLGILLTPSTGDLLPTSSLTGAGLDSLARHATLARTTFGIGILSDLVLVPGIIALFEALKGVDRDRMLVGSAFLGLYVILDLLVTGPNVVALVSISQNYATSTGAAQQASFAMASYIKSVISLSLPISSAVLSVGILLIGGVLRKGSVSPAAAYLSVASGVVGLAYGFGAVVPPLTGFQGLSAVLELAWFALMGGILLNMGRGVVSTTGGSSR